MKVTIGDMELNIADVATEHMTYPPWMEVHKQLHAEFAETVSAFLAVAQACYIERHGIKPERSTVEEF